MKPRALVVEDDGRIVETIEDTLFSIDHDHRWVTNQQDAREALQAEAFDYVLLDLQIPAKPNRGGADKEFGIHLLEHIDKTKGHDLPVIMMTANTGECLDLSSELSKKGATEFVAKPFQSKGRTLADVIRKVLAAKSAVGATGNANGGRSNTVRPFDGGVMTFHHNRVELCGVKIISDAGTGQSMAILKELSKKEKSGRFARKDGEALARAIDAVGVNPVTACVYHMRRNITKRLRKQLGIDCGLGDVVDHDEQGYFLRDWIVIVNSQPGRPCLGPSRAANV
jgi:CheY-like chemotaxis protein